MYTRLYDLKLPSYYDPWELHFMGDIHWDSAGCDRKAVIAKQNRIKSNPNARWIGMGDYNEYIGFKDPRFVARTVHISERIAEWDDWAKRQSKSIIKRLEPIKDQCIGLLWGNHEETIARFHDGRNVVRDYFVPALDTVFLGYECLIRVFVKELSGKTRYSVGVYCHHGYGGGKLMGSKALNLERLPTSYGANIYAMGHTHTPIAFPKDRLALTEKGNYVEEPIMVINTGSFLKTKQENMEFYEVKAGFPPASIATTYVTIKYNSRYHRGKEASKFKLSCTIGE